MQGAMTQLSNTMKGFKQILADILTPVVNVLAKVLVPILKLALVLFNLILIPAKIFVNALSKIFEFAEPGLQFISDSLDKLNSYMETLVQAGTDFGVVVMKIDAVLKSVLTLFGSKFSIVKSVFSATEKIFEVVGNKATALVSKAITPLSTFFSKFGTIGAKITGLLGKMSTFGGAFGRITSVLGIAGKTVPVIGWIITGLQAIWGLWTRLSSGMNIFQALGETLYDVLVGPFEMLVDLLAKIPVIGKLFEAIKPVFGMIKSGFSSVFGFIQEMFDGGFSGLWDKIVNGAKSFVSMIGSALLIGIKLLGDTLYTVFIQPWVDVWNFVSDLFVGKSNSTLGDGIIKGLIGVGSAILKIFVSPFEAIFDLIIKGFTSIGSLIQTVFSAPFKIIGKLVGVDTGGIGEGAGETGPSSDVIDAIERTNQKLDTLISLMMNGGIAVNLDGRKVSEQLAIASS